jgi:hypothetical protein
MFARAPTIDAVDKSVEDGAVTGEPLPLGKYAASSHFPQLRFRIN